MRNRALIGLALALGVASAIAVSACGGGGGGRAGDSATAAGASEISGTVTVWDIIASFSPTYAEASDKLDAAFEEKYPDVTVKHVDQPFENYTALYKAAFVAQEGPDVMNFPGGASGVLTYTQGLEPLNQLMPAGFEEELSGWEAVTPGFSREGEHYGVPIDENGFIFYYNKKLFEKAGLPRQFQPQTWKEVQEAGEKLQAAGIQPFTGGGKEGYENSSWFSAAWQTMNTEKNSVELGEGEIPYTDEIVTRAFEPQSVMQAAGLYPSEYFSTPLYPDGAASFGEEKGAISLGQWATASYYGEYAPKLGAANVGFFFPPGSKYIGTEPNWVWSIPKFARNKAAAWAYIEFLASQEGMQMLADLNPGEIPNREDVTLPKSLPPQGQEIVDAIAKHKTFPHILMFLPVNVWEAVWTEINQVLQGRTSLDDAQKALQEIAEKSGR